MNDNIDKNEIRRAIDKLQTEHPCHFAFDATKFDSADSIDVVKRVIDNVMESIWDDADIHIICEMAKLYLDGVKPTVERPVERPHGKWIPCSERLPEENICDDGYVEPSDYVLVFGDHGQYGVSRYWGNRRTKKTNPHSFSDWMDLEWFSQKPIAWMPLPAPYMKEGDEK